VKAIILAAGYATRLYPLTRDRAKSLLPIHGRPIIDYLIDQLHTIPDVDRIYVISNHRFAHQFEAWAAERENLDKTAVKHNIPIDVLDDQTTSEDDRLGAIGDLQYCIDQYEIDDDLIVLAGDNLFTGSLVNAWRVFRTHQQDMLLAAHLAADEDPKRFAIAQIDDLGMVQHLEEKPQQPRSDLAVYAIYFYRRDTVPLIREYLASGNNPDAPGHFPVWLHTRKPIRVHLLEGLCIDIGTPKAYQDVMTTFPVSTHDEHHQK
jgi:glucose-1-phosphate thymidylyltransferase